MNKTGLLGQKLLSTWCTEAQITCNRSDEDTAGWDFRLDFPHDTSCSLADIHKSALHCLIQVKATKTNRRTFRLKLTNLKRYITCLEPVFVLFVKFGHNDKPETAYLVHIGEQIIREGLEEIAKATTSVRKKPLNRSHMHIACKQSDELQHPNSECFSQRVHSHIGENIHSYIAKKRQILQRVGFDGQNGTIRFHISSVPTLIEQKQLVGTVVLIFIGWDSGK